MQYIDLKRQCRRDMYYSLITNALLTSLDKQYANVQFFAMQKYVFAAEKLPRSVVRVAFPRNNNSDENSTCAQTPLSSIHIIWRKADRCVLVYDHEGGKKTVAG